MDKKKLPISGLQTAHRTKLGMVNVPNKRPNMTNYTPGAKEKTAQTGKKLKDMTLYDVVGGFDKGTPAERQALVREKGDKTRR